jgi:hypothetical protein
MTIHQLLQNFDPLDLKVQFLNECMSNINAGKKKTKVTFETNALTPNDLVGETEPFGIIIWIDKEKWQQFQRELKEKTIKPPGARPN